MSRRMREELTDDLDDTLPADETVEFAMDGIAYQIDLAAPNAATMREQMAIYIRAGRRAVARRPRNAVDPSLVRAWARARGIPVGSRGRVPAAVIVQYLAEERGSRINGATSQ
ncbi:MULTISPECIES: histone-like nucleoid-structuring protein Lsr2 [Mycolicibacterium]|nr:MULTISPECIES: Lsr2 family protein [Mycolicibacterium]MCC9179433.1 Lsr2 family protein [Mycolicibacterium mageritense]